MQCFGQAETRMKKNPFYAWSRLQQLGVSQTTIVTLLLLRLSAIISEGIGLGMLLPTFQFIQSDNNVEKLIQEAPYCAYIVQVFELLGIKVTLISLITVSFVAVLMRQGIIYVERIYRYRAREAFVRDNRSKGFEAFLRAHSSFQERTNQGDVINALTAEIDRTTITVFEPVTLIGAIAMCSFYALGLFALSPEMTIAGLAAVGFTAISLRALIKRNGTSYSLLD